MRLVARKTGGAWLEEGAELDGYVVERVVDDHPRAELRYELSAADGRNATLVTSRRPLTERRERSRFRQLARIRTELEHPALIEVRQFGERRAQPYLITAPYPERTLGDLLAEGVPLSPGWLVRVLAPVAEAIDLAHACGLVHQSLDGDSVLLASRDRLVLDSFGLLTAEDDAAWSIIQPGDLRYRPPEQVRGEPLEARGNIYSLTALIFHALTGHAPYAGDRTAVSYAQLVEAPPRVSDRAPELGRAIDAVVERGMSKEPLERPESAAVLLRDVADALGIEPPVVEPPSPPARLHLVPSGPQSAPSTGGVRPGARARRAAVVAAVAVAGAAGALMAAQLEPFKDDAPAPRAVADSAAWNRLADRRAELRGELAAAETPQEQAATASQLAAAYAAGARADGPAPLRAAAREAGLAYSSLAAAADAGDEPAFAQAGGEVGAAERRFAAAAE